MDRQGTVGRTAWRGAAYRRDDDTQKPQHADGEVSGGRVLLAIGASGNRRRLAEHLRGHCEIIEPDETVFSRELMFDLAVTDITGFQRWYHHLLDAKVREEPTFLPVVLVISRRDLRQRLRTFWDAVDEFIVSPIDRDELTERVSMLLRARRLALAQRSHLAYLVNHDRATGLPNKNLFMDRLTQAVHDAAVLDRPLQVIVVQVPLARILRSLGHHGLERAAMNCSSRLRALLGEEATLARLTTDRWGVIHRPGAPMATVFEACARIQSLAELPLDVAGERVHVSPRIGIGVYPDDASTAAATLDCAMSALSEATSSKPVFYSRDVQHQALRFIRTEARLHEALEREQFELWFQPQVRLSDRSVVGVEALVRWRLDKGELVPPGDFIGVAEVTGLIRAIDRWVLDHACAAARGWRADRFGIERVSVNVSAQDINAEDFAEFVKRMLERHRLPPPALELELTETTLFEISDRNLRKLDELRTHGVSIAVDDFGTGYSSLSYLHRLPITTLKIDKAFLEEVTRNETNAAITRTIVWLARNFGLETIAEGIQDEEQAHYLQGLGVGIGQGFLYARPMPEPELRRWLARGP